MIRLDRKYKEMHRLCANYHDLIDKLRDQAYGYETSLDTVFPYDAEFCLEVVDKHSFGIDRFANELIFYCCNLSEEANDVFKTQTNEDDCKYIKALVLCIMFYLHSECNKSDYTYQGFLKILKSFLGHIEDLENAKELKTSVFWILYSDLGEKRDNHPVFIKEAFGTLFDDFDYNYASLLAEKLQYCVRFFIFENKYDYIGDRLLNLAVTDLIKEITVRLRTIHQNRIPRYGWRDSENE